MVGAERFELSTSCTPSKRASQATLRPDRNLLRKIRNLGCAQNCHVLLPTTPTKASVNEHEQQLQMAESLR